MDRDRVGIIEVSESALKDFWLNNEWFVPLDIDKQERNRMIRYYCYSKYFTVVQEGEEIPKYCLTFKRLDNGETILSNVEKY